MPITLLMPALSPTMETGKLAKWLKKVGDSVKSGDILAEIETDKATMEFEAIDDGKLGKILIEAGSEDIAINTPIAILLEEGEDITALKAVASSKTQPTKPQPTDVEKKPSMPAPEKIIEKTDRIFASPLARRVAAQRNIDLKQINGSGPHGRIILKDVEAAPSGAKLSAEHSATLSDQAVLKLFTPDQYELIPHDSMRKIIARRLVESKQTIPHFYLSVDCHLEQLLSLRERLNMQAPQSKEGGAAWKISVNDFVIKAWALALVRISDANASWTESAMIKHHQADIAVAVAIPGGLVTPIIRNAGNKGLVDISKEMKDLAARARVRKLKPEEYQGGSSAVSNLGMYGIKNFSAIINPPQSTILAVGAGEQRPVVKDNQVIIAQMMSVTLSTDHRVVDGALGAELLGVFKTYIEDPGLMLG